MLDSMPLLANDLNQRLTAIASKSVKKIVGALTAIARSWPAPVQAHRRADSAEARMQLYHRR